MDLKFLAGAIAIAIIIVVALYFLLFWEETIESFAIDVTNPSFEMTGSNGNYYASLDDVTYHENQWDDMIYTSDGYSGKALLYDVSKATPDIAYPYLRSDFIQIKPSLSYEITIYVKNEFSGGDPKGYTDKFMVELVTLNNYDNLVNDWYVLWNDNEIINTIGQPYFLEPQVYPVNADMEDFNGWKKVTISTQPFDQRSVKLALFFSPFENPAYESSTGTIIIDEISIREVLQ